MRYHKRIALSAICFLAFVWNILPLSLQAQDSKAKPDLDSLYNAFLNLKGVHPLPPAPRAGEPQRVKEQIPGKCGFSLVAQVRNNLSSFSPAQKSVLEKILEDRPVLQTSIISPSGFFRIHFNTTGDSIPNYDQALSPLENARQAAIAMDSAYKFEVNYLGFLPPPSDNGKGGDNRYDVYLMDISDYGYTQVDSMLGPEGLTATSYMVIDNDFNPGEHYYTTGLGGMYVTAAHEFHHAIQIGSYNATMNDEDLYFYEGTSTAMEELVFDTVDDYYQYLRNYFNQPDKPFYKYSKNESYTAVIWMLFQHYDFGKDIIREEWENFRQESSLRSMNTALAHHSSSLKQAMNTYGGWSFFTGYRTQQGKYFKEARNYPLLRPNYSLTMTSNEQMVDLFTDPLSNNFVRFLADNGSTIDTVVVILTNGDVQSAITNMGNTSGGAPDITENARLTLYTYAAANAVKIANNYYSLITADQPDIFLESDILNNILANGGTFNITELDFAFPNPFNYSKNQYVYLPVAPNKMNSASLKIFTSSMDLVFSGSGNIIPMYDSYTLQWNCSDSKGSRLPSGVYFYVTDSEGSLKKGKIVIQNE
ncbi:MAG TPA: MXAN_6640 family putative metalloprotease [Ignavibacteriales bacterium]|nr:MXAN_6640 family putative metalloprotease [Ignavibacteriales bacterium]